MSEIAEKIQESLEAASESRLNGFIALFVAITATFMALCNVKDGNIVQAMQQAQAKSIDQWAYFQSKSTKMHIAENTANIFTSQLEMSNGLSSGQQSKIKSRIEDQLKLVKKYQLETEAIKKEAEQASKDYDALNVHDDQFDLAEACLSVAIALAGVTALTRKRWLFGVALTLAAIGFIFGMAGFLQLQIHSDFMAKLLG